jgi:Zn-dependent metalloprotease/Mg-chelatase subunit ChlD
MRRNRNIVAFTVLGGIVLLALIIALASGGGGAGRTNSTPQPSQPGQSGQPAATPEVIGSLTPQQKMAFDRLSRASSVAPYVRVEFGVVRASSMRLVVPDSIAASPEEKARYFLNTYQDLYQLNDPASLAVNQNFSDSQGWNHVSFEQRVEGVPVYASGFTVHIDAQDAVTYINAAYAPGTVNQQTPSLSAQDAEQAVRNDRTDIQVTILGSPMLVYFDTTVFGNMLGAPTLTWRVIASTPEGTWFYFIHAGDGSIVHKVMDNYSVKNREVYDGQDQKYDGVAAGSSSPPPTLVMQEAGAVNGTTPNDDAQAAYDNTGIVYDFYKNDYGRESFDGLGNIPIKSYVNVKFDYPNAMYSGYYQAFFYSTDYTRGLDVVAHEFTHAVTDFTVGLRYETQSGALSESYSDVMAAMIDSDNWTMGEDLPRGFWTKAWGKIMDWFGGNSCQNEGIVRDLSNPGRCNQPKHMDDFETLKPGEIADCSDKGNDCGYVHKNSGIPNYSAYLLSEGGTAYGVTVTGLGREKTGHIWYNSLAGLFLSQTATFQDARDGQFQACLNAAGSNSITEDDCFQVLNAWAAVGVGKPAVVTIPTKVFSASSSVLLLDTSGSMADNDQSGKTKIESAVAAAQSLLDIIKAENQMLIGANQVGVADFNAASQVDMPLSSSIENARIALNGLTPSGTTAMADGLQTAIQMFTAGSPTGTNIIVLLSDGVPNVGLNGNTMIDISTVQQQLMDLAQTAKQNKICIYTIGFGIPMTVSTNTGEASIDEDLLKKIAETSGCGKYYNAQDATQLSNTYTLLRHISTGNVLFQQSGQISQNQTVSIGTVNVPAGQIVLLFTLNWPGSRLDPVLTDPSGKQVDANYVGASISVSNAIATVLVNNPKVGQWKIATIGSEVPEGTTNFQAIVSSRQGPAAPPPATTSGSGGALAAILVVMAIGGVVVYALARRRPSSGAAVAIRTAELVGLSGEYRGRRIPLQNGFLIGRRSFCNLQLHDSTVSREHARLRFAQGNWYIQDVGSRTGFHVNGLLVRASVLRSGDRICIGASEFEFNSKGS